MHLLLWVREGGEGVRVGREDEGVRVGREGKGRGGEVL